MLGVWMAPVMAQEMMTFFGHGAFACSIKAVLRRVMPERLLCLQVATADG